MLDRGRDVISMLLYTWKDVERKLLLNKDKWGTVIVDIETYTDEVIVHLNEEGTEKDADTLFDEIFDKKYENEKHRILLDLTDEYLNVTFEIEEGGEKKSVVAPLFKSVLYQKSAYYDALIEKELPGVPVIAFHSYKGGVGRTLYLLAFVKAWYSLKDMKNPKKLLVVDADIEAPGITWLTKGQEEAAFSFLDLLEITQEKENVDEIIELISDKMSELSIKIETEKTIVEHIVLPTYRYIEQLLDMYSSPESLAISYSKKMLLEYMRNEHDILEWKEIWKKVVLDAVNKAYQSLEEFEEELKQKCIKVVFLIDGLEEIFQHTILSQNERNAVAALCRDLIDEVKISYHNLGFMIFLRKDMVRDSLTINYEQFHSLYRSVELQWSSTEALRLAAWLTSQAVSDFYEEDVPLEMAPRDVIDQTLHKLWGVKLGKPTSNEANSSRWILAALSDFNGQLQARDIIRFLEKATVNAGKPVYTDRYLMPTEIKKAVSECSTDKIGEIRDEIKALGPIFDKLEHAPAEDKILPFSGDTFQLTQGEEKIMKQEGYLRIDNDRYYLPEIIRHALKFKYGKGARPKVLSLLLK